MWKFYKLQSKKPRYKWLFLPSNPEILYFRWNIKIWEPESSNDLLSVMEPVKQKRSWNLGTLTFSFSLCHMWLRRNNLNFISSSSLKFASSRAPLTTVHLDWFPHERSSFLQTHRLHLFTFYRLFKPFQKHLLADKTSSWGIPLMEWELKKWIINTNNNICRFLVQVNSSLLWTWVKLWVS